MNNIPEKVFPPQDLKTCTVCGRRFLAERIKAHEAICHVSSNTSRKPFDITEQILKGADTGGPLQENEEQDCQATAQKSARSGLNTNWRRKHEEFLKMIKEAKEQAEKRQAAQSQTSGLRSDLDSVLCHYCLRPYNKMAVTRHMTICSLKNYK